MKRENIIDILADNAKNKADIVTFTFLDYSDGKEQATDITNIEIYRNAKNIAAALKKTGLQKDDRVVIFTNQSCNDIYALCGTMIAGGIFILIPPPTDNNKISRFCSVLKSAKPKIVLTNDKIAAAMQNSQNGGFELAPGEDGYAVLNSDHMETYTDIEPRAQINGDDTAYLQYSSGSTSDPKGVIVSHKNLITNLRAFDNKIKVEKSRTIVSWAPFFHNSGLIVAVFCALHSGRRLVQMATADFVQNPLRWLKAIDRYKAEYILAPNSIYALCAKIITEEQAGALDLSSLNYMINGAELTSYQTLTDFSNKFARSGVKFENFCPGYGMSECVCAFSTSIGKPVVQYLQYDAFKNNQFIAAGRDDLFAKETVSQGVPFTEQKKVVIVDPYTEKACKENEIGEIWIQGDDVCRGYWDMPEETERVFRKPLEGHEGTFLRTGDLGAVYEGALYVTGRIKEVIIINGHNISPHDIKITMQANIPALAGAETAIFSIMVDKKERVVICIESDEDESLFPGIASEINKVVSRYFDFSPYDIVFTKRFALHRTDSAKLKTYAIKDAYENDAINKVYAMRSKQSVLHKEHQVHLDDAVESLVKMIFEAVLSRSVNPNDSFLELGGDSFDTLVLISNLEKAFDLALDIKEILAKPSILGISEHIKNKRHKEQKQSETTFRLYDDCVLEENIRPLCAYTIAPEQAENIFLTGSTGFLGAHLIEAMIRQFDKDNLIIYCHVRAENAAKGFERIKNNMRRYDCWKDSYAPHIAAVPGDLGKPLLGLSVKDFKALSERIDIIYHNGALLNFMFPYDFLKSANCKAVISLKPKKGLGCFLIAA
jgi:acyl-CoA synthetase (AMP-forming)/AMP-acid ligase II/acyl carrier protein